jgi:F-type H+-transporting ATPase subunit a
MRRLITWIIILIVVGFLCGFLPFGLPTLPKLFPPVLPAISVKAETAFEIFGIPVSNTLVATVLADLILIGLFFAGTRNLKLVPEGLQNFLEMILEFLYNLIEQVAGARARSIFPLGATIFLLVLTANYMEFIPGLMDNFGKIEPVHEEGVQGYEIEQAGPIAWLTPDKVERTSEGEAAAHEEENVPIKEQCHEVGCVVVPFVRVVSTDLNFTAALALISVFMTQVYGVRALGAGEYFSRFFNTRGFRRSLIFGPLDFAVSILEAISEVVKIISFTFRLFGNIFAGSVLIFVFSWMVPAILPVGVYLLELFVGAIQAFVFMMLTVVFIQLATAGHGGEGHEEAHAEAH